MTRFTAKRTPSQLGPAAWDEILPPRAAGPVLDQGIRADVTIIGGGFAGLAAARIQRASGWLGKLSAIVFGGLALRLAWN